MNLTRTFDAESEALSLTDVRDHLRIIDATNDDSLRLFIAAIRKQTENYLGKTLIKSTWELKLDSFGELTTLPMPNITQILSASYVDTDGNTQTFTDFQYDSGGRFMPSFGNGFPSTRFQFDAVTITYTAGASHAGNVDDDIKLAMLLWIGACDLNREDIAFTTISTIPNSAKNMLALHKVWRL